MSLIRKKYQPDDLLAMHQQSKTYLHLLYTKHNNLSFNYRIRDKELGAAVKRVYEEAKLLHKNSTAQDAAAVVSLNQALQAVMDVLESPGSQIKIRALQRVANEAAPGKPSQWKKFIGALLLLAGAALVAFGIVGIPMTGALSCLGVFAGGGMMVGGVALIQHGSKKRGVAKALDGVVDIAKERAMLTSCTRH